MNETCEICHAKPTITNPVLSLREPYPRNASDHGRLHICAQCVERRELASWDLRSDEGRAVSLGLRGHPEVSRPRYAYLQDNARMHVIRLRSDWLHSHEVV